MIGIFNILILRADHNKYHLFLWCDEVLEASLTNSVGLDQTAPKGAVWSGSTLFASILTFVNIVSKYLQQMT